jgi:hypothetical protein
MERNSAIVVGYNLWIEQPSGARASEPAFLGRHPKELASPERSLGWRPRWGNRSIY